MNLNVAENLTRSGRDALEAMVEGLHQIRVEN